MSDGQKEDVNNKLGAPYRKWDNIITDWIRVSLQELCWGALHSTKPSGAGVFNFIKEASESSSWWQ